MSGQPPSVHEVLRRLVSAVEGVDRGRNEVCRPDEQIDPRLSAAMDALDGCRLELLEQAARLAQQIGVRVP
jgi:hypothetical protein